MSYKLSLSSSGNIQKEEGSEDSFWIENYPKLQRYCRFIAQNKWDGDDIAQEVYLKAIKSYAHQQSITSALLNKMAYNHWIDILRKRKNETIDSGLELANNAVSSQLEDITNTVEIVLRQFTPKQAIIFLLKEAFQYQLKEIADILGTTEMAVKSSLHRAKKRIEKDKQEEQSISNELFWEEEERERLSILFYEALKNQDPQLLIHTIPTLKIISEVPKLVSGKFRSIQTQTPSSTLCMAA